MPESSTFYLCAIRGSLRVHIVHHRALAFAQGAITARSRVNLGINLELDAATMAGSDVLGHLSRP